MVTMLRRKLLRDLVRMKGQVITIALVVAAGTAVFVASVSAYQMLLAARETAYLDGRFADVFVSVKRAPLAAANEIAGIDGVVHASARTTQDVIIDWPASAMPVAGRVTTLPRSGDLGQLWLTSGRWPRPDRGTEVLVSEGFGRENALAPGDNLTVLLNGRRTILTVTGTAGSPEYLFPARPDMPLPDEAHYAIIWMDGSALAPALGLKSAFNDLAVKLAPGTDAATVMAAMDRILDRYGSFGAIAREDQPSHRFLSDELRQQRLTAETIPIIFWIVAAFLLNIAIGRIVTAQREQVATLRAMGYPDRSIARHYMEFAAVIVGLGSTFGILLGDLLGRAMAASYQDFFRFPAAHFELVAWSAAVSSMGSLIVGAAGAAIAVRRIARQTPAEALRTPATAAFRRSMIERILPRHLRTPRALMVIRSLVGRPVRSVLTTVGVSLALPLVVLGVFWWDAVEQVLGVQFGLVERGNASIVFPSPKEEGVVQDLMRIHGIILAEPQRNVAVRLRKGHRSLLTGIVGLRPDSRLTRALDADGQPIRVSEGGVLLPRRLAERLSVATGDTVTLEILEGRRARVDVPVTGLFDPVLGHTPYAAFDWLHRLTGEAGTVSSVSLYADLDRQRELGTVFKTTPATQAILFKSQAIGAFLEKIAGMVLIAAAILTAFACVIAVGVVYNTARIAFNERSWELSCLRVLGFTRGEVSHLLLIELAILVSVAIPLGLVLSRNVIALLLRAFQNDSFSFPATIEPRSFLLAGGVVAAASLASALVVRRRIDTLDLVATLKSRD